MARKSHTALLETVLIILSSASFALADECPTPPTDIYPTVSVKVNYDKKSKIYTYDYTLANGSASKLAIGNLALKISEKPLDSSSPSPKWIRSFDEGTIELPSKFRWSTVSEDIKPGSKQSGFVLKSYRAPAPIRYFTIGETGIRVGTPNAEDDEPIPECPGFFDDAPEFDDRINGIVDGPAPENQLAVDLKLMDDSGERDCGPISPYEDKGQLNVLLKMSKGSKVSDIDLNSLRFGVGRAPLASSKRLGRSEEVILLRFDTQKTAIECGRDRILFLSGKTKDGKDLFGGAPVKTKNCDKRSSHSKPHR